MHRSCPRYRPVESCIAHIVAGTFERHVRCPAVDNKPFALIVLALVVLIALAVWQFYSLAWGDVANTSRYTRNAPSVATAPR